MQVETLSYDNTFLPRQDALFDKVDSTPEAIPIESLKIASPKTPHHKKAKRVKFDARNPVSKRCGSKDDLTKQEKNRVWWTTKELQAMKERARTLACNIHERRFENDLDFSYVEVLEELYAQRGHLSRESELKFWTCISHGHSRRGLERLSAQNMGRCRKMKAVSSVRNVLKSQRDLAKLGVDDDKRAEMIANVYKCQTGSARDLAEAMGKADEVAAILQQTGEC